MKLEEIIQLILKEQSLGFKHIPVDITISNGNILLRSFHIYDFNEEERTLKGLTQQEEYAYAREERDPVYCFLRLDEIKELSSQDLDLEFHSELALVKV